MKKVLIISYFFPPIGGGGVQRVAKFAKYLGQFGWQPHVLTVKKGFYPLKDQSLLADLPKNLKISRIGYFEPGFWFSWRSWRSFLTYFLYPILCFPDNQILWFLPALISAYRIIKKEKIRIIFTSSASYSDHLIALALKKLTGIKWVADFRDQWQFRRWHQNIDRLLEKSILEQADRVTTISDGLTSIYQKVLAKDEGKFITITNGFDEEDFAQIENQKFKTPKKNKELKIVHVGSLYGSRRAETFLRVFNQLKLKNAQLEFIGQKKRWPHKVAIEKMLDADVLLLVLAKTDGPAVLTGKIFEYLRAKKPIIVLGPPVAGASRLVKKLKVGEIVDPDDKNGIAEVIKKYYQRWQKNQLFVPFLNLEAYERKNLTAKLAEVFASLRNNASQKIKICFIGNLNSIQNQLLVSNLKGQNLDIHFITTKKIKYPKVKTYYLEPSASTPWYFARSLFKIRKIIKEVRPDIVHGQDLVFAGIWAYLSGHRPYIVTTWGSDILKYKSFIKIEQWLIRKSLLAADLVTGPALHLGRRAGEIAKNNIAYEVVHFGVDTQKFLSLKSKNFKKKYPKEKIIFCPRAIAPIYNTDVLIDAFRRISQIIPAHLVLLGKNAHQSYLIEMEKMLIKHQLLDRVTILPPISDDNLIDVYNSSDLVVTLASSDGCPSSFLEAMLLGKKIVVTDLDFTKEWFDRKNFWKVPIRDGKKTTEAIIRALRYPEKQWQPIAIVNRQMIIERAEASKNARKLANKYQINLNK